MSFPKGICARNTKNLSFSFRREALTAAAPSGRQVRTNPVLGEGQGAKGLPAGGMPEIG